MEKKNTTMVSIPKPTLNALKNMLFAKGTGLDISNIINDLALNTEQKDIIAINVALAQNGTRVDIDQRTRYEHIGDNEIQVYEYVGFSLINGMVKVFSYICHKDDVRFIGKSDTTTANFTIDIAEWDEMETDVNEILNRI